MRLVVHHNHRQNCSISSLIRLRFISAYLDTFNVLGIRISQINATINLSIRICLCNLLFLFIFQTISSLQIDLDSKFISSSSRGIPPEGHFPYPCVLIPHYLFRARDQNTQSSFPDFCRAITAGLISPQHPRAPLPRGASCRRWLDRFPAFLPGRQRQLLPPGESRGNCSPNQIAEGDKDQ